MNTLRRRRQGRENPEYPLYAPSRSALVHRPTDTSDSFNAAATSAGSMPCFNIVIALRRRCALGATRFSHNRDWWEAEWELVRFLEPLLDPDTPLGPMARLLLVMGLTMKEPGQRGLATDVLIAAIDDGRLDETTLGSTLGWLVARELLVLPRIAADRRHATHRRRHVIVARTEDRGRRQWALCEAQADPPRDLYALLELLRELLCETGEVVTVDGARTHLRKHKGAGKPGKLAKELLALQPSPSSCHKSAVERLLIGRITRARRWA